MSALWLAFRIALAASSPDSLTGFQAALESKAQGDLERAESQLGQVCQASPGWALPWVELGEVQLARGEVERAQASVAQAAVLDPANPRVYHDRALVERAMGRPDLAERDEAFALGLRPEYAEAQAGLAELRWAAGRRQEALTLLQALCAAHPEEVSYAVRLIDAYSELGQPLAAERELRVLIAREPQSPIWHRKLGRLLAAQGLKDEAAHENALADELSHPASEHRKLRGLPKSKR